MERLMYCYRNLTRHVWAVAEKPNATPTYMPEGCVLKDVTFSVSLKRWVWCNTHPMPNGKPRRKVHAYAIGELVAQVAPVGAPLGDWVRVEYDIAGDPWFFRTDTRIQVRGAAFMVFTPHNGAFAVAPY
jgi:hypothetical protein